MAYIVGIDLGTTFSAAAVAVDGATAVFPLGTRLAVIPSVVYLRPDGELLTGEAAERRAATDPERVAAEFKRRLGDPTPLLLAGTPYGAEALMGVLLRDILERIVQERGEQPTCTVLTHPANYNDYKLGLLEEAARYARVSRVAFVSEPEAAALHYSSGERVDPGSLIGVYDFGGGTFDASVVEKTTEGFALRGNPEGLDRLGGIDLDDAVLSHVRRSLGGVIEDLDADDPAVINALLRLRSDCRLAKESLSADTETSIPVMLPGIHTEVRLTRAEFEDMVRPRVRDTMDAFERAVVSAGAEFSDLAKVLLVGGSSRMPLVAEIVRSHTDRPVALDANPKHAIALGAAEFGKAAEARRPSAASVPVEHDQMTSASSAPSRTDRRNSGLIAGGIALVVALIAALSFALAGDDPPDRDAAASAPTATTAVTLEEAVSPTATSPPATAPQTTAPQVTTTSEVATTTSVAPTSTSVIPTFFQVTDDTGTFIVDVPGDWREFDPSARIDEGEPPYPTLSAAPDLDSFIESYDGPGLFIQFAPLTGPIDTEAAVELIVDPDRQVCTDGGREDYTFEPYNGYSYFLFNCGGTETDLVFVIGWFDNRLDYFLTIAFQYKSDEEYGQFGRVLSSLRMVDR